MSLQVNSIDTQELHKILKGNKTPEGKQIWNYVQKLNEALESQKDITKKAVGKVREASINTIDYFHYESLISCCNKLLDAVDKNEVPVVQINGLRMLLNREI